MKRIVKYSNKLNTLGIHSMSSVENSVFFALIHKLENQKDTAIELSLAEIKKLIGASHQTDKYIHNAINAMAEKFSRFSVKDKKDNYTDFFAVFEVLRVPTKSQEPYIKAKLSNRFLDIINDVDSQFTLFDLAIYTSFSSKYSQTAYRLIRQFNSTGYLKMKFEEFKEALNIPTSYNMDTIDRRVIKQIENDFLARNLYIQKLLDKNGKPILDEKGKPITQGLTIRKLKTKGNGNKNTHIEFIFTPETKSNYEKLQEQENTTPKDLQYAESVANRQQILENQKAKQEIKQHELAALAAGCNAWKVDEPQDEREARIKKEVQRTNMSTIMKTYAGRWFTYNNTSYKIDNFEFSADGELVLFVRLEDNTPARYMHEFESINHFENYVKDYLI